MVLPVNFAVTWRFLLGASELIYFFVCMERNCITLKKMLQHKKPSRSGSVHPCINDKNRRDEVTTDYAHKPN